MNVLYGTEDRVAFVQLTRPPVNSLDRAARRELIDAIDRAVTDPQVDAIVLWGGPDVFCAGADITEFSRGLDGEAFVEPTLTHVVDTVESSPKPVVAAIAGPCMGGGLELALACHYRLIASSARLALPEIKLGLIPGAGGTQRLPRLIGVAKALSMMLSGDTVSAACAIEFGIGRAVAGDLRMAAAEWTRQIVGKQVLRLRSMTAQVPQGLAEGSYFEGERARVKSALPAPQRCIDAVRAAATIPFDAGIRVERDCFRQLMQSPEAKALRYAFFSDRRAAVIDGLAAKTDSRRIDAVGVVGAGTMGTGIALCALNAGLPTVLIESRPAALAQAVMRMRGHYDGALAKGRLDASERDRQLSLLTTSTDYSALANADLIIEAVFEDMSVKREVFQTLDRVAKPSAILASNTSTLDVERIAAATPRTDLTLGLHFFSPAHVMRLLEVVRTSRTSPGTLVTAMTLAKRLGKTAVVARVCDGFIGNRMFEEYLRQAYFLLDEGATPGQIDGALEKWGMAMGPLAVMDLAGGDIGWAIRKRRSLEQPGRPYSKIPDRLCELGRLGRKTGAGYYRYDAKGTRIQDHKIEDLIVAYSREVGLARRHVPDEEIVARCVLALVNEAARLLAEGIAQRGSDIDVVYRNGYGFPAHRGGPLFYADEVGLAGVIARMESFRQGYHGQFWEPAPLLLDCVQRGARLSGA